MCNNPRPYLVVVFLCILAFVNAQECSIKVTGEVFDRASVLPLSYVNVVVQETYQATITDENGFFELEDLCPGKYHLIFSHIGCEAVKRHIKINKDTIISIELSHTIESIGTVIIDGKREKFGAQPTVSIGRKKIEDNSNLNLAGLIENESGVSLIKNGSGISKPVVHGLYGNRLTILNNGVIQSGQQWGNDHSPEIDPFSADKISVLKGVSAIEYASGSLGGVVLVEPSKISDEPHLHGGFNYVYESNGRGNTLNARLEKSSPLLAWRLTGTLRKYGDRRSPNYLLNNTGTQEANLALQLEKKWSEKFSMEWYASTFNARLGVLRGSHIGNLTDLELALERTVPYYTEEQFSYNIEAPKQHVAHHLFKWKSNYLFNEHHSIQFTLAGQLNDRKEFDVRRGGRTDIPALSLLQYQGNVDVKYSHIFGDNWTFKIGNQNRITDNTNNPETGILPLIPDYFSWNSGLYQTVSKGFEKIELKLGFRYDLEQQKVLAISDDLPREIIRYNNVFHNLGGQLSLQYQFSSLHSLAFNSGYTMRNPAINELYSNGLHQGVSGIEEGDIDLKTEKAVKNTLEYQWLPNTTFTFNALVYHQFIEDYIFLNPQEEFRLTIRGVFPVFKYEQTNAQIYGLDLTAKFTVKNVLSGVLKYSFLRGDDLTNNTPLVFMPPNTLFGSLSYRVKQGIKLGEKVRLEEIELEVNNRLVFQQNHLLDNQDFAPPPGLYNLLGTKISTNVVFGSYSFRLFAKINNLGNVRYRDYLNRQRYFADDLGISVSIGTSFKF